MKRIMKRMYWKFWNALRKIGVWDTCPNCDSGWHVGRDMDEECIICGYDYKNECSNGWVWGWVVPNFIKNRIISRRIEEANMEEQILTAIRNAKEKQQST